MAKETYIYNELQAQIEKKSSFQENAGKILQYLKENYAIESCLCEIIGGRRWSFITGSKGIIAGSQKVKINDQLGLVIKNYNNLNHKEWEAVFTVIKELKFNHSEADIYS